MHILEEFLPCSEAKAYCYHSSIWLLISLMFVLTTYLPLSENCHAMVYELCALDMLKEAIDEEIKDVVFTIENNEVSNPRDISDLKAKLNTIWEEVKLHNKSERLEKHSEWRAAFIILQGIIEQSIARLLTETKIILVEGFIITPYIPTPFTVPYGKALDQVLLTDSLALAKFRRIILEEYLKAGGILHAIYTNSKSSSDNNIDEQKIRIYRGLIERYHTLIDHPAIHLIPSSFPLEKSGAIYYFNQDSTQVVTFQSHQWQQIINASNQNRLWSIKLGIEAIPRTQETKRFLEKYGAGDTIDY